MDLQLSYRSYVHCQKSRTAKTIFYFPLLMFFIFFLIVGCESLPFKDPLSGPFPYKFEIEQPVAKESRFYDLNNDGQEEMIFIKNDSYKKSGNSYAHIYDSNFTLINQLNFTGEIRKYFIIDWTEDGNNEIFFAFDNNDSLFLRIIDFRGKTLVNKVFLLSGKNRISSSGEKYDWKGKVDFLFYKDLDSDGKKELILFPDEAYACKPRGVYVYDGKSFKLKWKYEIGASIGETPIFIDSNKDGLLEIVIPTTAPANGHKMNGTDDYHSYLLSFDCTGELKWQRNFGGKFTSVSTELIDIDGDGKDEILSFFSNWNNSNKKPSIHIINPQNGQSLRSREFNMSKAGFVFIQADRDVNKELIVYDIGNKNKSTLLLLDDQFNDIFSKEFNTIIPSLFNPGDINGDGLDEIFVNLINGQTVLMNAKFKPLASISLYPNYFRESFLYHRKNEKPLLAFKDDKSGYLISLRKEPHYLISYYGTFAGQLLVGALIIALILSTVKYKKRTAYLQTLLYKFSSLYNYPLFILDEKVKLIYANPEGKKILKIDDKKLPLNLNNISDKKSEVVTSLQWLKNSEKIQQNKKIKIGEKPEHAYAFVAEPVFPDNVKKSQWLVMFLPISKQEEIRQTKTWAAMAQRIAHDIKNPLTSILLSLQRLQLEYQDRDKKNIDNYDQYTNRIIERIEFLRRQSRDFMKFVNLEKINLQPTDLNEVIKNIFIDAIIEIPTDIFLEKKLSPELPTTHLDQEQIQTVVENLLTNAINAMPDGGKITISTSLASDLQLPNGLEKNSDYIIMEIMDTGVGIPEKMKDKLFLPFSTNTHLGTGLGLTIVKKIIDDHNGFIEVNSEQGSGTSFSVYLPVA